jgi:hypothetical protein
MFFLSYIYIPRHSWRCPLVALPVRLMSAPTWLIGGGGSPNRHAVVPTSPADGQSSSLAYSEIHIYVPSAVLRTRTRTRTRPVPVYPPRTRPRPPPVPVPSPFNKLRCAKFQSH